MARIFITGSADGLGLMAAKALIDEGNQVVLHARSEERAGEALKKLPAAEDVLTADLVKVEEVEHVASKVNSLGSFDVVIHNAGLYRASAEDIFKVNTLAPYILTSLMQKPKRLIYLSSDMHLQGSAKLETFKTATDRISYSDSKLHVLLLAKAVARKWPHVFANAINPGWVPTKMGGAGAPDNLQKGYETQVWLATSNEEKAMVSGRYFYHKKESSYNYEADDVAVQERFLRTCEDITGVEFPE